MTSTAKQRNGTVPPGSGIAFAGKDPVVIVQGGTARGGYTDAAAWTTELLQGAMDSPPVLFEGDDTPQTVGLHDVQVSFVKSLAAEESFEPIHFHDNLPHAELLWVRLVLENGEMLEGMMQNSEDLVLHNSLVLIPTDPQTNRERVIFPRHTVREFHVLGVRRA